jgi:hypothetical protein
MKIIYFLVFLYTVSFRAASQETFSKDNILYDLHYLRTSLEDTHFNLYAFTNEDHFQQNFLKVKHEVKKDSFTRLEANKIFQKVVAAANNGHTRVPFPVQSYITYAQQEGTLLPIEVTFGEGKTLIRKNWSTNQNIKIGSELLGINSVPIKEVLEAIYPLVSAERLCFKKAQIENLTLPRYYWYAFGEQKKFELEILHQGKREVVQVNAINAINQFEMQREDILKQDWHLKYFENKTAYIRPGAFGGDLEKYKHFIDSAFIEINKNKTQNLIIDLRNHPGGDDAFGDYLVSYISDKPFKWASRFQLKTSLQLKENIRQTKDTTQAYWKSILEHKDGDIYNYDLGFYEPQPKHKRFQEKVYVLVNRQSYSQSTVTAAQIQDYGWGTIVGEETAEFPNLYASIYNYPLPKTGITVEVSKGKIERISGIDNNKGIIPDIIIKDHLLDEEDEILEGILKRIKD